MPPGTSRRREFRYPANLDHSSLRLAYIVIKRFLSLLILCSILTTLVFVVPLVEVSIVIVDGVKYLAYPGMRIEVRLEYKHSVELEDIVEEYEIYECRIQLVRFVWSGYGAGLPSSLDELGRLRSSNASRLVLEEIPISSNTLRLEIKFMVNPKITINGKIVEASDEVVLVACSKVPLVDVIISRRLLTCC